MSKSFALFGTLILLASFAAAAQDLEEDGCVYDRRVYPEGYELCQSGTLKRCVNGGWSDIGDCAEKPMKQPIDDGGDVDKPEPQQPQR